jgi:hypothetical protein
LEGPFAPCYAKYIIAEKGSECRFLDFKRRVTLRQVEILASLKETGSITETARRTPRKTLAFEALF